VTGPNGGYRIKSTGTEGAPGAAPIQKQTSVTQPMALELGRGPPPSISHRRSVASEEPETTRRPSGENATAFTGSPWPLERARSPTFLCGM
jgi:hypothetical protein